MNEFCISKLVLLCYVNAVGPCLHTLQDALKYCSEFCHICWINGERVDEF